MKVLLTEASGFVGSHILDCLRLRGLSTVLLLRPNRSRRDFIARHLPDVEVRPGEIGDLSSLREALVGITHVIHCAGATKAARVAGFYEVNQLGTRNVVAAVNERASQVKRLVHISSLAAAGSAPPSRPAREDDLPHPVSAYGKSKLAGETEIRSRCRTEYVILRPPAVYGPRDGEFLRLFAAVKRHILPKPGCAQALSLVFVRDLAEAIIACLDHAAAAGKIYFTASREVVTACQLALAIAAEMKTWTVPLPLPTLALWPICLAQELVSRLTGKPNVLSLQKFAELRAPGWVCDPSRLEREIGYTCATPLKAGVDATLTWYQEHHWL